MENAIDIKLEGMNEKLMNNLEKEGLMLGFVPGIIFMK